VAQERLQIRLDAVDNTKKAFNGLKGNTDSAKTSLLNLKNVLVGLGAGLAIKSIINVGTQIEGLGVRFKFLFGSVKEGNRAFDELTKFAGKVPFSLEEISAASGNLAVVSKDAKELAKILEITGNVAAVTGLDFQTTASQIQRAFSGGIAAADVFREKGVRDLLGFSAGATISAEQTVAKFEEVFGKGGRFGGATAELAKTFEGTLSMLGDKLFGFKSTIIKAGFFDTLKKEFGDLNKYAEDNAKALEKVAVTIGTVMGEAVIALSDGFKFLADNSETVLIIFKAFVATKIVGTLIDIGKAIRVAYIATAAWVGLTGVGLAAVAASVAAAGLAYVGLGKIIDGVAEKAKEANHAFNNKDFEHELSIYVAGDLEEALIILHEFEHELSVAVPNAIEKIGMAFNDLVIKDLQALEEKMNNIHLIIAQGMLDGIKAVSDTLAETIILGKSLGDAFRQFVV
jgi:hypothetical protein